MADCKKYGRTANLFDKDNATVYDCYVTSNGQWATGVGNKTVRISCDSNTQYTLSTASTYSAFRITETDSDNIPSDGSPVSGTLIYYGSGNAYTFTTSNTAKYIIFQANGASLSQWLSELMFNTGSTALPYQPYLDWLHSLRKLGTATDTITTLPADLYADGTNATVGLKGNMSQTGTPTPDNPIQPSECGERTGNLFDYTVSESGTITSTGALEPNTSCWRSTIYYEIDETKTYRASKAKDTIRICYYDSSKTFISREQITSENNKIITIPSGTKYIKWTLYASAGLPDLAAVEAMKIMLSEGSEIISYEPYGYKLTISSANTTTPVYLGEVESTRQIKKLVLTGQETVGTAGAGTGIYYIQIQNGVDTQYGGVCCTHYVNQQVPNADMLDKRIKETKSGTYGDVIAIKDTDLTTIPEFTTYLAQQYTAGTPVTVWYVLSSATTGILNEPLRKIGNYADTVSGITIPTITGKDTFDVQTTPKPSEVEVTYTGWHDASVQEKSRNLFDITDYVAGKYIDASGNEQTSSGAMNHSNYITVSANSEYTLSSNKPAFTNVTYAIAWYDSNKTFISRDSWLAPDSQGRYDFTGASPNNAAYAIINFALYPSYKNEQIMLNTGSTALPYEPYWK